MTDATRQTAEGTERLIVQCTECRFQRTAPFEGTVPAEIVIEHGRETGHKLQVKRK